MKSTAWKCILPVITVFLFAALAIPVRLRAQEGGAITDTDNVAKHHRYKVFDIGTFGGPVSYMNPVGNGGPYTNRHGVVVGTSATSVAAGPTANGFFCLGLDGTVPFLVHAFAWKDGAVTNLGALPPASTNCSSALAVNSSGLMAGGSENGLVDPFSGVNEIHGVIWKDGEIHDLGTFGGNFSTAQVINSRGQIAGFALNEVPESFSMFATILGGPSARTQTRAFLWEDGHMKDLGTLGGPNAWAFLINEQGQVAGRSYTDSTANSTTGFPTMHPFLWKNGKMLDLGSLGGTVASPTALNDRGLVIGNSNLVGDQAADPFLWDGEKLIDLTVQSGGNIVSANAINNAGDIVGGVCLPGGSLCHQVGCEQSHQCHAFRWRDGVVTDLGTLPGDCESEAFAINTRGQIVGQSFNCDTGITRLFLWDQGAMIDLNSFVPPGSGLQLVEAIAISDDGEIAGDLVPPSCGGDAQCGHAFVLIPCDADVDARAEGCSDGDAVQPGSMSASPRHRTKLRTWVRFPSPAP